MAIFLSLSRLAITKPQDDFLYSFPLKYFIMHVSFCITGQVCSQGLDQEMLLSDIYYRVHRDVRYS